MVVKAEGAQAVEAKVVEVTVAGETVAGAKAVGAMVVAERAAEGSVGVVGSMTAVPK